jgi:hypothetical protein
VRKPEGAILRAFSFRTGVLGFNGQAAWVSPAKAESFREVRLSTRKRNRRRGPCESLDMKYRLRILGGIRFQLWAIRLAVLSIVFLTGAAADAETATCEDRASPACYFAFPLAGQKGNLHFYASLGLDISSVVTSPSSALIALHGHPRDANKTFDAALLAVKRANALAQTVVVAPVFQVSATEADRCQTAGVPVAQEDDLLWTCESWLEGGAASNANSVTSFAALDAIVDEVLHRWPSLRTVTIAGFSAGAQMVQHYVGFATEPPKILVRYVIADPGTWLYFDNVRPFPELDGSSAAWSACVGGATGVGRCTLILNPPQGTCPTLNRWKYGTEDLPARLGRTAAEARKHYTEADVSYLEGELDSSPAKGTFYRILDKSCAASAQGPYRLQRGVAYAYYDRTLVAPDKQRKVVIVPACAHDVACVFPSPAARSSLLGPDK